MVQKVILRLTSLSEKKFFDIAQKNSIVSLKYFYRKINAKQASQAIKRLDSLQKYLNIVIFVRKTKFCQFTGHPITSLNFKGDIEIKELDKDVFAIISTL